MQDEPSLGRLRWRCRRGMKELDVVLERWLAQSYPTADAGRREVFQRLLDEQDPQLVAWLFGQERPADRDVAALVEEIASGGG